MLLGNIRVSARAGANKAPNRIVVTEGPSRDDFPEANFVANLGNFEIGALFDAQCSTHVDRNRDLALGSDLDYLHEGILAVRKLVCQPLLIRQEDLLSKNSVNVGAWSACQWLRATLGDRTIEQRRQSRGRGVDRRALHLWQVLLGLPESQVGSWLSAPERRVWDRRTS